MMIYTGGALLMSLKLRKVVKEDALLIYNWKMDSLVKEMALDFDYKTSVEAQLEDITNTLANEFADYNIITINRKPIGYIRIDWMDHHKHTAWLRFALGEQRGLGYGKQALSLYVQQLFSKGCKRVEGEIYAINIVSQKVLEKVGFKQEGIKRKAHFTGLEFIDVLVYGLIEEDL